MTPEKNPLVRMRVTLTRTTTPRMIDAYLPSNYGITGADGNYVYIEGHDHAGWTSQYVIDRLASGLIWGAVTETEGNPAS